MKLYYSKGACSLGIRILINELGLTCDYESVDLSNKKTEKGEDFTKINPKGYVPALKTDQGNLLTENLVIQQYLADTHQEANLLPKIGDFRRYQTLEWSAYISTELHKGFSPLLNPNLAAAVKEEIYIPALKKKLAFTDQALGSKKYLMGNQFTISDAYLFVMLFWAEKMKLDIQNCQNLTRYYQELKNYPAIKKSLEQEGL